MKGADINKFHWWHSVGPRSLKLTEVVPSLKLAPRSTEAVRSCTMRYRV